MTKDDVAKSLFLSQASQVLDVEIQGRIRWDHSTSTALPVGKIWREHQLTDAMRLHRWQLVPIAQNAKIPSTDDLVGPDHESKRLAAIIRAVEHTAGHLRVQ